jgi:hypothetical protein
MGEVSTTELLIVKEGEKYIRFLETGFEYCPMNKASVFSLRSVEEVKERCSLIRSQTAELQLMKLVICEEPFLE